MIFLNELKFIIRLKVCLSGELNFYVLMGVLIRIIYICIQKYDDNSKQNIFLVFPMLRMIYIN